MPNARVGAMPQPPQQHETYHFQQEGGARGRRQQGITMQDLKQQTAIRLAHEQQRQNALGGKSEERGQHLHPDSLTPKALIHHVGTHHDVHGNNVNKYYSHDQCMSNDSKQEVFQPHQMSQQTVSSRYLGHIGGVDQHVVASNSIDSKHFSGNRCIPGVANSDGNLRHVNQSDFLHVQPGRQSQQQIQQPHNNKTGRVQQIKISKKKDHKMNTSSENNLKVTIKSQRNGKQYHRSGHSHHIPFKGNQTGVSSSGHHQRHVPGKSSKLPHGLTVEELKEMTRARLAAETREVRQSEYQVTQDNAPRHNSSNAFMKNKPNRQGSTSIDSADYTRNRLNSAETSFSAPSGAQSLSHSGTSLFRTLSNQSLTDQYHHNAQFHQQGRQQMYYSNNGSIPSDEIAKHVHSKVTMDGSIDWKQHLDPIETASINSINSGLGSEYLGSDTPGLNSSTCGLHSATSADDYSRYSFGRSVSYPSGANIGIALENPSNSFLHVNGNSSVFDPTLSASNRRRAATMSPPVLSQLFEDQPLAAEKEISLSARTFESSVQGCSRVSSPANSRVEGVGAPLADGGWYDIFGRPSSAATVPTTAQSIESFSAQDDDAILPLSFGPNDRNLSSGGISRNGEVANSVAESVLGAPYTNDYIQPSVSRRLNIGDNAPGLSAVFRSANNETVPGRDITLNSTSSGGFRFSDISASNRNHGSEVHGTNSCGGSVGIDIVHDEDGEAAYQESLTMTQLENDLNALLTMSGEGEYYRSSSLISKIDPELDEQALPGSNVNIGFSSPEVCIPVNISSSSSSQHGLNAMSSHQTSSDLSRKSPSTNGADGISSDQKSVASQFSLSHSKSSRRKRSGNRNRKNKT